MENEVVDSGSVNDEVKVDEPPVEHESHDNNEPAEEQPEHDAGESESEDEEDISEKSIDDLPLPGDSDDKPKKELPNWLKNKIAKKERELAAREAEALRYREELERVNSQPNLQNNNAHDANAPRREDFDSDDDYIDARFDYRQRRAENDSREKQRQQAVIEGEVNFQKKLKSAVDSGSEKYEDFEEKTEALWQPTFPSNRAMAQAIVDSDYKDDILYFLGNYSDHAKKIALMDPVRAIKEIAKLETRFAEKKKSNVTKTSKPLKPLKSNKTNIAAEDPNKMDMETYTKWYKKKFG